jgi:hypothetical protein
MTWKEIKKAVDDAGIKDDEEISLIQCENGHGNKTFTKVKLGKFVKLAENHKEDAEEYAGCAV